MTRREFLEKSTITGAGLLLSVNNLISMSNENRLALPKMKLQWCNYKTTRPFQPDVDSKGNIWFGSAEHFFNLDTKTMKVEEHDAIFLQGKPLSTCICQNNKIYILAQKSSHIFVYDPSQKTFSKYALPDPESNIWFGLRVANDPRLYLYVRNKSKLLIWDCEKETGHEIPYPERMDLWSGFYIPGDNAIFSFTIDAKPSRLIRFDLLTQKFDIPIPAPEPQLEITGVNPIGDSVYCADRFTGRIFPFNFVKRQWGKPINVPGYKTVFGFIGMGTSYNGLALYCLSTYKGSMKYDFDTNKYLSKGDENIGIDGKPHHFLNKYLVLDPKTHQTSFLEAAEIPGKRYPLICYSMVYQNKLFISGYDLGDVHNNLAPMGERQGELCVYHSI
jgi:streptogramin lyase